MALINIRVTGLNEAVSFFNTVSSQLPQTNKAVLEQAGDLFVREAQKNAHVVTGRMKSSITKGTVLGNSITVSANAPYSAFENRRIGAKPGQGTHSFWTRAAETTVRSLPQLIKTGYNQILKPR